MKPELRDETDCNTMSVKHEVEIQEWQTREPMLCLPELLRVPYRAQRVLQPALEHPKTQGGPYANEKTRLNRVSDED